MGTIAPDGYLKCDGATYNIEDYPLLAKHFEDNFGTKNYFGGDGTTTFKVHDLRGEFLRGTGTNSHSNGGSGVAVGTHQAPTEIPYYQTNMNNGVVLLYGITTRVQGQSVVPSNMDSAGNTAVGGDGTTATGTPNQRDITGLGKSTFTLRPTNTSVLYLIKY